ncbi:MAG: hypothetical protein M1379_07105 [Firmicutes bacterium]|nr:hypothetical protein [Bacillota bacterium]
MDWRDEYIKKLNEDVGEVKGDLRGLRADMKALGESLHAEIRSVENSLRAEIKAGETSLHNELNDFRRETRVFARWAFGFMITMVIGFLGVIRTGSGH